MEGPPSSTFRGVSWHKERKKWQAVIFKEGKSTRLGYFDDEEEAALKYDEVAATLGRPLNSPPAGHEVSTMPTRDLSNIPNKGQSTFRGVCWNKGSKKWQAVIFKEGKSTRLGYFDDEEEAARKYDEAAATLGRLLNFPKAEGEARAAKMSHGRDLTKIPDKGQSAFRGVSWKKGNKKWEAKIKKDGKKVYLGYFDDEKEAARKYDEVAATLRRPLNFPKAEGEASALLRPPSSAFRGVSWNKGGKKWVANIQKDGMKAYLGYFDDEEEAARKYDEVAATLGRPLNFPADGTVDKLSRPPNKRRRDSTSTVREERVGSLQFTGVTWLEANKKWVAEIQVDGKRTYLGCYLDEEAAARKYDEAAATLGMPLNFDMSMPDYPGAKQNKR